MVVAVSHLSADCTCRFDVRHRLDTADKDSLLPIPYLYASV